MPDYNCGPSNPVRWLLLGLFAAVCVLIWYLGGGLDAWLVR